MGFVIRPEHVRPFIASTMETITKMIGLEARPERAVIKMGSASDYDTSPVA